MSSEKPPRRAGSLPQFQPVVVPVFDCHVILSRVDEPSTIRGRVANFPSISAEGATERDVLVKIVAQFKACLRDHQARQEEIPWQEPADAPGPGDVERWVPVHL